jgi:hypothetical protein
MTVQLGPRETLLMWRLLARNGAEWWSELAKIGFEANDRRALVDTEFVNVVKVKRQLHLSLTPKGWDWIHDNLEAELSKQGKAAIDTIRCIMRQFNARIAQARFSLADFCDRPVPKETIASDATAPDRDGATHMQMSGDLKRRILAECHHLKDGAYSGRIRLADLRQHFPDVPRGAMDEALKDLERSHRVNVYPLDNPQELTDQDVGAALPNSSGDARHILYLATAE